jgi:Domain of unknown function (DUF1929)/Legume lectin domain
MSIRSLGRAIVTVYVMGILSGCGENGTGQSASSPGVNAKNATNPTAFEQDVNAPVNRVMNFVSHAATNAIITPASNAATQGGWSAPISWPIIGIHSVLNPDGNVLTYGTDQNGQQGAQLVYDIWNPNTGLHNVLPNKTGTDIFCGTQVLIPSDGTVLMGGGDVRGKKIIQADGSLYVNAGVNDVNLFNYKDSSLVASGMPMAFARWYASLTTLADGKIIIQGGLDQNKADVRTTEVFTPKQGWKTLTGIKNTYGSSAYPRSFVMPNGKLLGLSGDTQIFSIDPSGQGEMHVAGQLPSTTLWELPTAMFDRGKVLVLRRDGAASVIDGNSGTPVVTETAGVGNNRYWSSLTVLPDGQVVMTGGGALGPDGHPNQGINTAVQAMLWNPKTGQWTPGASAQNAREYHSTALLLPDATVLIAGGGAPGPINQLNAEIYSPPYLFKKDGSGTLANRPTILNAANTLPLNAAYGFDVTSALPIQRVTLVKTGSVTHSVNFDQRFLEIPFQVTGNHVSLNVNENSNTLTPGYYLLFAIDSAGVPSVAKIVSILPTTTVSASLSSNENFATFSGNNRVGLNGSANLSGNSVLLNAQTPGATGSLFARAPTAVDGSTSFSATFQFRITGGADGGIAYVIQGNNSNALGTGGATGFGYQGITKSLAIVMNQNNEISLLSNGSLTPLATAKAPFNLRDGTPHTAWIDYDGTRKSLTVYVAPTGTQKPTLSSLSYTVDLVATLGNLMYQGFTASAGQSGNPQFIDIWSFSVGSTPALGSDRLLQGQQLFAWQSVLKSANRQFQLALQRDGNMVLTQLTTGTRKVLWQSNTAKKGASRLVLQTDGNLVLYDKASTALWASNTAGSTGSYLVVQNDGNLVIYDQNNHPIWASNTVTPVTYYQIKNIWKNTYLFDGGDSLKYGTTPANDFNYQWSLEDRSGGYFDFKNRQTGEYINIEHNLSYVESNNRPVGGYSSKWAFEYIDTTIFRLRNGWHLNEYMHVENSTGYVQHGLIDPAWWSARWTLVPVK